ncbi:MAG: cadherin repeat domain-containing protein, partial [Propionibacteriaceae bacterium]|nr:cadherin repeat domain-containing protein [Propionibacteriaceae bacterium]
SGNLIYGGIIEPDHAQIYKYVNGEWHNIGDFYTDTRDNGRASWSISAVTGDDVSTGWHTQELRVYGSTAELYIDGYFIGSADLTNSDVEGGVPADADYSLNGQVGFWSQYDNNTGLRDNFTVRQHSAAEVTRLSSTEGFRVDENSANGTVVGDVLATDPDGDTLTYSITAGNTGSAFDIDNNGRITVNNSTMLDFETNPTFTLTVEVDDGNGETDTDTVTINLNDVNDAPVEASIEGAALAYTENDGAVAITSSLAIS